jgi:hypothetical protein
MLESSRAYVDRTINSYPGLVQHLLKVYATESAMMRAQAAFYQMMQHTGENVPLFASRLQEQAGLLGTLYTAEKLKGKFWLLVLVVFSQLLAPVTRMKALWL